MKTEKLVVPDGKEYNDEDNVEKEKKESTKKAAEETSEESVEEQAQTYYDEIMEEDPKICKALYELLKDKYEGEKESAVEKAAETKTSGDESYDIEGMPT